LSIYYLDNVAKCEKHSHFMRSIIDECSHEFFPPLTARKSTTEKNLAGGDNTVDIGTDAYVEGLLAQENIFATSDNDDLIGFMSFIHNRLGEPIFDNLNYGTNNYISTICIKKQFRNHGIGQLFYDFIEHSLPDNLAANFVSTRTWSENKNHIHLLEKRGYTLVYTGISDREWSGVRTSSVYYVKKTNNFIPNLEEENPR